MLRKSSRDLSSGVIRLGQKKKKNDRAKEEKQERQVYLQGLIDKLKDELRHRQVAMEKQLKVK